MEKRGKHKAGFEPIIYPYLALISELLGLYSEYVGTNGGYTLRSHCNILTYRGLNNIATISQTTYFLNFRVLSLNCIREGLIGNTFLWVQVAYMQSHYVHKWSRNLLTHICINGYHPIPRQWTSPSWASFGASIEDAFAQMTAVYYEFMVSSFHIVISRSE